jgi:hypothetical protein
MTYEKLTQRQRLAAELYAYSLANYSDHLGNERFTRYMPESVDVLERAVKEGWDDQKTAKALEMDAEKVPQLVERLADAHKVVDAPNASESFRESVRQQLAEFLRDKGVDEKELEKIVVQMCYCASDLGCLLEWEGKRLTDYSEWLRRTPDCDYSGIDLPNLPSFREVEK